MTMIKKVSILFLLFWSLVAVAFGKTTNLTTTGNWGTAGNWSNGLPAAGDVVNINVGKTATINNTYDISVGSAVTLNVSGTIKFNNNPSFLKLPCGSTINILTGGTITNATSGGNSCELYICGVLVYETTGCTAPCSSGTISGPATVTSSGLPVELLNFTGVVKNEFVTLSWETATELNFDYFSLGKSTTGFNFSEIAQIQGHGTTPLSHSYFYNDRNPLIGKNYYQLKSVDFDGYTEIFNTVVVDFNSTKLFSISPNPSKGEAIRFSINFSPSEETMIAIFNNLGVELLRQPITNSEMTITLNQPLETGIYYARIMSNSFSDSQRFIVIR